VTPTEAAARVKRRALELGFDSVGIADLRPTPHASALVKWLSEGMAGTMEYMGRQADRRTHPARIVPDASSAIVVTRNYFNSDPPKAPNTGRIAKYARGPDYHESLKKPLTDLCKYVKSIGPEDTIAKCYVDAGPVPERELAQRAGLGWIGKNTMLIDERRGSFFFLASVFTGLDLAVDEPYRADRCGSCTRCLDACPTTAFPRERVLDSRRCISYLTIEHKGGIDPQLRAKMGDWVFGCDVCQNVCPWNLKFASIVSDPVLGLESVRAYEDLDCLIHIKDEQFAERFGWTPLDRPGVVGMRRNARIAATNATKDSVCQTSPTL
jgi:epoxyqueuosine reductase